MTALTGSEAGPAEQDAAGRDEGRSGLRYLLGSQRALLLGDWSVGHVLYLAHLARLRPPICRGIVSLSHIASLCHGRQTQ